MLKAIVPSLSIGRHQNGGMIAAGVLFFFTWLAGEIMRDKATDS
jgi:hypothetical protein